MHTININNGNTREIGTLSTKKNLLVHFVTEHGNMFVFYRPYLFRFLEEIEKKYNIIIYTNGTEQYANIVLAAVGYKMNNQVIKKCYPRNGNILLKYLSAVTEADPNNTIIIDDTPQVWPDDKKYVVPIQRFLGPVDDNYLDDDYLEKLECLLSHITTYQHPDKNNIFSFIEYVKDKYCSFSEIDQQCLLSLTTKFVDE